jgi:RND superfamily putative drug exporter
VIREFGLCLAAGIFVDAVIIRATVIPAVMLLLGRANWWFPKRLDRVLPTIHVDHVDDLDQDAIDEADSHPARPELVGASVVTSTP